MEKLLKNKDYLTDTVFSLICDIKDPELNQTLEDLEVVTEDQISFESREFIEFKKMKLIQPKLKNF